MKYNIIHYNKWRYAACIYIPAIILIPFIVYLLRFETLGYILTGILSILYFVFALFILPDKFSKANVEIEIKEDRLLFDWVQPFVFSQRKLLEIEFRDIESYKYERSYQFNLFKLNLLNGNIFKIHRENETPDDFSIFFKHFANAVENHNKTSNMNFVSKRNTILDNKVFLITTATILGTLIIILLYIILFKEIKNIKGFIPLLILLGPFIWLINEIKKRLANDSINEGE